MTETDPRELLSALLDREPVDPDRLAGLLEDAEARALLVDFVRLRSALHAEDDTVSPARPPVAPGRRAFGPVFQIAAALVLVALGALGGRHFATTDPDAPPEPTRVVQLVPGTGGGGSR